ncbi:hypothetical protein EXS73_01065 [Candidatus Pacearchaeota archaeon]|nr:hypothetical protein [Candidatus Pacearchaeota archaeon]
MRKGDLLTDNFLEILLAVIGLVLVGYVAYQIYQVTVNQDVTIAKKMLDSLEAKINVLKVGEEGEFSLRTPYSSKEASNWFITGWSNTDLHRPEKCYFESCVCACRGIGNGGGWEDNLRTRTCQESGYCRFFDDSLIVVKGIDEVSIIGNVGTDPIPTLQKTGQTKEEPYIRLQQGLMLFKVSKTTEGVTIRST